MKLNGASCVFLRSHGSGVRYRSDHLLTRRSHHRSQRPLQDGRPRNRRSHQYRLLVPRRRGCLFRGSRAVPPCIRPTGSKQLKAYSEFFCGSSHTWFLLIEREVSIDCRFHLDKESSLHIPSWYSSDYALLTTIAAENLCSRRCSCEPCYTIRASASPIRRNGNRMTVPTAYAVLRAQCPVVFRPSWLWWL